MKVVVLDAYTANPGDVSWEELCCLGEVIVYERTREEEVLKRAQDADVVLTNKVLITRQLMDSLPRLRYIGVLATGYNVVDLQAAKEHGVIVTNVPAYSTVSVAQMVFAHILNITNSVSHYAHEVKADRWTKSQDFCFYDTRLIELDGLVMGIVGLGNIGMSVAQMAKAFGMKVVAVSSKSAPSLEAMGIEKADSYDELFSKSDILSLHCPLTEDTYHLVNTERLALMKPTAILINTGRGPLIDELALADALNSQRLYAAGVDVLAEEPPRNGSPLLGARNCYITPHIAWATLEARQRLLTIAIENVKAFAEGNPVNVVNVER